MYTELTTGWDPDITQGRWGASIFKKSQQHTKCEGLQLPGVQAPVTHRET